jgi:predicted PurR-regulated permease PerM
MEENNKQTGNGRRGAFGQWFGLLLVIIVALVIYYCLSNLSVIFQGFQYILRVISPVIYGLVIAYLLNPLMKFYQRCLEKLFSEKPQKKKKPDETKREAFRGLMNGISIVLAMISGILIISVLLWMIVPQVITSVGTLVNTLPEQAENYYHQVRKWIEDNPYFANQFRDAVLTFTGSLDEWIQTDLFPWLQSKILPNVNSLAATFASGLFNVLGVLYNLLIGCIVAVYLLSGKERFLAQAKKLIYAVFGKKQADIILYYSSLANDTFSGFISGKIVDSTIVGVICFVAMCIFKLPYALLVSVIVGVTNVIPVFGPYIGAIPSAFLILLVSPIQCLYFIIIIVILQQLDGNVIGPTILGESTGLSAFWVLFAILLFGGMWGIVGMLIGVPLFAVIYRLLKDYLELRLYHKGLSTETTMYQGLKCIRTDERGETQYIPFSSTERQSTAERKKDEDGKMTPQEQEEMADPEQEKGGKL